MNKIKKEFKLIIDDIREGYVRNVQDIFDLVIVCGVGLCVLAIGLFIVGASAEVFTL